MLTAAIETTTSGGPGPVADGDDTGLTLHAGRRGRVAVVRIAHEWDGAGGEGPWPLVERALCARARLVVLDLTGRPQTVDAGAIRRLVDRLNDHGVRYALVTDDVDRLPDIGPGAPVYPSTAIARGTL